MGVEANVYFGYAFQKGKRDVLDVWSGAFQSAEATVETPYLKLSVGGAIFRSPDNTVWGALVQAAVGVNALGPRPRIRSPSKRSKSAASRSRGLAVADARRSADHISSTPSARSSSFASGRPSCASASALQPFFGAAAAAVAVFLFGSALDVAAPVAAAGPPAAAILS